MIDTDEQLQAVLNRFLSLEEDSRYLLELIRFMQGYVKRKQEATFSQFRTYLGHYNMRLLDGFAKNDSKVRDILPQAEKLLEQIMSQKTALSYYEIGLPKASVARAKLDFPQDASIQRLLDGYLARALGEDWGKLQRTLEAARKLAE